MKKTETWTLNYEDFLTFFLRKDQFLTSTNCKDELSIISSPIIPLLALVEKEVNTASIQHYGKQTVILRIFSSYLIISERCCSRNYLKLPEKVSHCQKSSWGTIIQIIFMSPAGLAVWGLQHSSLDVHVHRRSSLTFISCHSSTYYYHECVLTF